MTRMKEVSLQEIYSELKNNPLFLEEFKKNPLEACKNKGWELTEEHLAIINSAPELKNNKSKNQELDKRINK